MVSRLLILFSAFFVVISSENTRSGQSRRGKLLTFNTVDDDITVSLEFSVPFLTIPVKKTIDTAYGFGLPTINVNFASLALAATVVFGSTVVLPFILKKTAHEHDDYRYSRFYIRWRRRNGSSVEPSINPRGVFIIPYVRKKKKNSLSCMDELYIVIDNTQFGADTILDFTSQMLSDGGDFQGCALRIACWSAQRSSFDPMKMLNKITENQVLSTMINATAVEDAMISGRKGRDCSTFVPCLLKEEHASFILRNIAILVNNSYR